MQTKSAEVTLLLPDGYPDEVTVAWLCDVFALTPTTVKHAISTGKLPARSITSANGGTALWLANPEHALLIWGNRLLARATETDES